MKKIFIFAIMMAILLTAASAFALQAAGEVEVISSPQTASSQLATVEDLKAAFAKQKEETDWLSVREKKTRTVLSDKIGGIGEKLDQGLDGVNRNIEDTTEAVNSLADVSEKIADGVLAGNSQAAKLGEKIDNFLYWIIGAVILAALLIIAVVWQRTGGIPRLEKAVDEVPIRTIEINQTMEPGSEIKLNDIAGKNIRYEIDHTDDGKFITLHVRGKNGDVNDPQSIDRQTVSRLTDLKRSVTKTMEEYFAGNASELQKAVIENEMRRGFLKVTSSQSQQQNQQQAVNS